MAGAVATPKVEICLALSWTAVTNDRGKIAWQEGLPLKADILVHGRPTLALPAITT